MLTLLKSLELLTCRPYFASCLMTSCLMVDSARLVDIIMEGKGASEKNK